MGAIYPDARNPFAHGGVLAAEGLEAWTVPETWVMDGPEAAMYVDVTDTFHRKIDALRAHASQTGHMTDLEDRLRSWLGRGAKAAGLPDGRLVETFQVVNTN